MPLHNGMNKYDYFQNRSSVINHILTDVGNIDKLYTVFFNIKTKYGVTVSRSKDRAHQIIGMSYSQLLRVEVAPFINANCVTTFTPMHTSNTGLLRRRENVN